ncbi:MAG: hypothetical protein V7754_17995 [Halioglobus sp.]
MTDQDHELLSQYLDGELGAPQVRQLEQRLATEPALQAQLVNLRAIDSTVKAAFNVPGADTVPPQVTRMLQKPANNVVAFPQRRKAAWGFAVAASLMAASGVLFFEESGQPAADNRLADTQLFEELERAPSRGEGWNLLGDGRQVRPILSFHSKSDGWCREYMLAEQGELWRGVACRGENRWINTVISSQDIGAAGSADQYRPASAADTDQVQSFVRTQADGIALSANEEAELINKGWK